MARARIEGFEVVEQLFKDLSNNIDGIAIEAVNHAVPALEKSMRECITESANKGYATGQLAASVMATPAEKNKYGVYSVVKPNGQNADGMPNAKEAAILEYGRKGGYTGKKSAKATTTQEPHPFRQKAINRAAAECERIMKETVESKIEKIAGG